MTETTEALSLAQLEQLIDCTEEEMPSLRQVQMLASEVLRNRSYGSMIPDADSELKQRAGILLKSFKQHPQLEAALARVQALLGDKVGTDMVATLKDACHFIIGDAGLDTGEWIDMPLDLLNQIEATIHDAVGHGASHNVKNHNTALMNLHKYIQNANGSSHTLVPQAFVSQAISAIEEITYGKVYSERHREELLDNLRGYENDGPFPLPSRT